MNKYLTFCIVLLISFSFNLAQAQNPTKSEISFKSANDISVVADLYLIEDKEAPFIILCHQAEYSRGEYIETAPKFNKLGYNCMAIDARSGGGVNGIENKTFNEANEKGLETNYPDAMPDIQAAVKYVKDKFSPDEIILVGSSYSASLAIIVASNTLGITNVLAFSPGEYFLYKGKKIQEYAKDVRCPIFITSAKNELNYWEDIIKNIPEPLAYSFKPKVKGIHGSRALWTSTEGYETYWEAVENFLK